jgi:glutaminase
MMKSESDLARRQSGRVLALFVCLGLFVGVGLPASARDDARRAGATDSRANLQKLVDEAYAKFKDVREGKNADYIPALAKVPSELFGVVIATREGVLVAAGDVDYTFSIQSVSKPFTMARIMDQQGYEAVREKIGVEPTGLPFNSKLAIEIYKAKSVNPLVNAGAIAAVSLLPAKSEAERIQMTIDNLSRFAGAKLTVLKDIYDSEYSTAFGNRAIANLLYNSGRLYSEPEEALRAYTEQCSVGVTARQLAVMGATLANGGVNPVTKKRVVREDIVDEVLAVMLTAGFYDESGRWSAEAGVPAKTGVGGGIVAVVPGRLAIASFSPPVNEAGNSVRAQLAIKFIADRLGASLFKGH